MHWCAASFLVGIWSQWVVVVLGQSSAFQQQQPIDDAPSPSLAQAGIDLATKSNLESRLKMALDKEHQADQKAALRKAEQRVHSAEDEAAQEVRSAESETAQARAAQNAAESEAAQDRAAEKAAEDKAAEQVHSAESQAEQTVAAEKAAEDKAAQQVHSAKSEAAREVVAQKAAESHAEHLQATEKTTEDQASKAKVEQAVAEAERAEAKEKEEKQVVQGLLDANRCKVLGALCAVVIVGLLCGGSKFFTKPDSEETEASEEKSVRKALKAEQGELRWALKSLTASLLEKKEQLQAGSK